MPWGVLAASGSRHPDPRGLGTWQHSTRCWGCLIAPSQAGSQGQLCLGGLGRSPQHLGPGHGTISTNAEQGPLCGWVLPSADNPTQTQELGHLQGSPLRGAQGPRSMEKMGHQVLGAVLPHGTLLGLSLAGPSQGFVVMPSRRGAAKLTKTHPGAAGGRGRRPRSGL